MTGIKTISIGSVIIITTATIDDLNKIPYKEGVIVINYSHDIFRYDLNGRITYSLNYNGHYLIIENPNEIGNLIILDDGRSLNDIKHCKGNVIIGDNFYAVDSSDIAREITIFRNV